MREDVLGMKNYLTVAKYLSYKDKLNHSHVCTCTISDCSFAITVRIDPLIHRLILSINHPNNYTEITTATTLTSLNNLTESAAVIITKQMNQTISNHCQIASLEVYRGKKHSIEINHCGFSLSDMGEIEVIIIIIMIRQSEGNIF